MRHILPNVVAPITVAASFGIAGAILTEAGLSFLGLGVQVPTPSWGNMLNEAQNIQIIENMPWYWLPTRPDDHHLRPRHQLHRRRPPRCP